MATEKIRGAEALIRALIAEQTEYIFGYPGGAIMPVFDVLYDYRDQINHILVRHEQGATHAAQGYARVSGKTGVVLVTSGPAATNIITGLSDAMMDSTPLIVITGQVGSSLLGSDAFQETDVVGITQPVTKWSYQIRRSDEIAWAVARAFYIAGNGRPGPVVLDFAKDAQTGLTDFDYQPCQFIRSYNPYPAIKPKSMRPPASSTRPANPLSWPDRACSSPRPKPNWPLWSKRPTSPWAAPCWVSRPSPPTTRSTRACWACTAAWPPISRPTNATCSSP